MLKSFDHIVIGAGSAGSVIAEGLSASSSVLLIEAGRKRQPLEVRIPAAFSKNFKTERDWAFESDPEPTANGRRLFLPRGKIAGGSSAISAMIYIRGRASDYDRWEAIGAIGWGWDSVLPVFMEMESNSRGASEYHGSNGLLRVEDIRNPNPYTRRFIEAAIETGMTPNPDFNGPDQEGVGFFQVTQKKNRRWSAADAFLGAAVTRPTLQLLVGSHCLRVIVQKGRAIGVEYLLNGRRETAYSNGEVILSAGTFGSPHLLQLSGIGDAKVLTANGVDPIVANPHVGFHMKDHPIIGVIQRSIKGGTLDDAETIGELARWLVFRRGRLTSNVAEAGAFVRSALELDEPDLEYHFGPVYFDNHGMTPLDGHAYSLGPLLMHPHSEGEVLLGDTDPLSPPRIKGNYLADSEDLATLVRGLRIAREILSTFPFDDVRGEEILPGPEVTTTTGLEEFVREKYELLYHPIGTCRMGGPDDAVVSPDLEVYGVEGLRVADASVMPSTISGNTNAAAMMIGARAVEKIRG